MAQEGSIINDINICQPIRSVKELYNYMKNPPFWAQLVIPLAKRSKAVKNFDLYQGLKVCHISKDALNIPARYEYGSLPKTLICHDMKNGYHDDRCVSFLQIALQMFDFYYF